MQYCLNVFQETGSAHQASISDQQLTEVAGIKYHPVMATVVNEATSIFHNATLADLGKIRQYVRETAVSFPCERANLDELIVAVDEAISNIIQHGYRNEPGDIHVTIQYTANQITIILLDNSPNFDPTTVSQPDTTLPLAERPFGGMGVHMIRSFCDEVHYRQDAKGKNELMLIKRFN